MDTLSVSAGICLVVGAVIFFTGAGVPQMYKAWTASSRLEYLQPVAAHGRAWKFTTVSFVVGVMLNTLGYTLLRSILIGGFVLCLTHIVGLIVFYGIWIDFW